MKLNKQQIQKIEDYLNDKKIDYLDIRFEVLDHLASDIETKMETSNIDFKASFEEVKLKWNKSFKETSSLMLGLIYQGPSVVIDKCVKIYKPYLLKGLALIILCGLSYKFLIKNLFSEEMIFDVIFILFSVVYTWVVFYWFFNIKRTKLKSSYSFLYSTQILPNLFLMVLILTNLNDNSFLRFDSFSFTFFSVLILSFFAGFSFYKNHFKTIEKYQLQ